ncbi:Ribosomal RNA small subunit methyltransferase B [Chromobacterium violaceum]|uniref:Ribosomal RNA small subunit methyltransferase B n=1 Tax=Chromobacterium violaceum TaxID=536 RepID=A0A447TL73_CHRVL|nr:Ribosomal RNA small subunit methyltransferase B [Chromobacterium violaceum]
MYQIQQLAAEILARIEAGTTLTDALADAQRQAGKLTPAERGALQDLSYGSLRHLGVLRHCLRQLVPHPLPEPQVERLLLIALYQLQYTRAAQYAVVHEAVTLAGMMARGKFKALVNGVLRNFQRRRDELLANAAADEVAQANHPDWWVARLKEAYPAEWRAILEASNVHPPLTLRVNRRRISVDDYLRRLEEAGLAAKALGGDAVQLARPVAVRDLPGFAEGLASVQDEGAQRAAYWLDLKPGMRVLDACAAPGGKTGHMLEMADVEVTALDIDNARLARVGDNLRRLGLSAQLIEADASRPDEWWGGRPSTASWPMCLARPPAWCGAIPTSSGFAGPAISRRWESSRRGWPMRCGRCSPAGEKCYTLPARFFPKKTACSWKASSSATRMRRA